MTKETGKASKKIDIPKTARPYFKSWIKHHPDSGHTTDWELFYMFVSVLLYRSRKDRSRSWLKEIINDNTNKLNQEQIGEYCDVYEHIKNYKNVWKSHTAKIIHLPTNRINEK